MGVRSAHCGTRWNRPAALSRRCARWSWLCRSRLRTISPDRGGGATCRFLLVSLRRGDRPRRRRRVDLICRGSLREGDCVRRESLATFTCRPSPRWRRRRRDGLRTPRPVRTPRCIDDQKWTALGSEKTDFPMMFKSSLSTNPGTSPRTPPLRLRRWALASSLLTVAPTCVCICCRPRLLLQSLR